MPRSKPSTHRRKGSSLVHHVDDVTPFARDCESYALDLNRAITAARAAEAEAKPYVDAAAAKRGVANTIKASLLRAQEALAAARAVGPVSL